MDRVLYSAIIIILLLLPVKGYDYVEKHDLIDDSVLLSDVRAVRGDGIDSLILADNTGNLYLLVDYHIKKTIGKSGHGPCEYTSSSYFRVIHDTLIVFDRSQSKLVWYSIRNDGCLKERIIEGLTGFNAFETVDGNFYFLQTKLVSSFPGDRILLYQLEKTGKLVPLNLKFSDLDIGVFRTPVNMLSPFEGYDNKLYFAFPYSDKLWIYDIRTDTIRRIDLGLEVPDKSEMMGANSPDAMKKLMDNSELVVQVFPIKAMIGVKIVNNKQKRSYMKYFSHDGNYLYQQDIMGICFFMNHDYTLSVGQLSDEESEYPYAVFKWKNRPKVAK